MDAKDKGLTPELDPISQLSTCAPLKQQSQVASIDRGSCTDVDLVFPFLSCTADNHLPLYSWLFVHHAEPQAASPEHFGGCMQQSRICLMSSPS